MSSPQWSIEKALSSKLQGITGLSNQPVDLVTAVPQPEVFPYIQIDTYTENAANTFDHLGKDGTLTFHIFSDYEGDKEIVFIHNQLDALLDTKQKQDRLVLDDGHSLIICSMEFATMVPEPDSIRHKAIRYRFRTIEN